ncbi:hypothetical protein [Fulvivirga ligni]|uniref:hypothetical protein n=1 Tax=Fulvivirga ligni TaxID=2904246 RepID=UPI001F42CA6A|nr:hypothetical protein [Fulvivirga ligni]UII24175.1 hypothetical protein LVD16_13215 [Fulvivirga ligni]
MDCISNKRCYDTAEQAEDALLRSHMQYQHHQGPVNFYRCDYCHAYHLTSKGDVHNSLKSSDNKSKIKLGQEASYWEDKFKK